MEDRRAHLERWREVCVKHAARLSAAISREVGKVKWEADLEAKMEAEGVRLGTQIAKDQSSINQTKPTRGE